MKELSTEEKYVIEQKGTERPYSGKYNDFYEEGVYTCKKCGVPLYKSADKFKSGCGWPSFDDEIEGAIQRTIDEDGRRVEITCKNCGGHLGHVFEGEGFTPKNTRHCVNSISLDFVPFKYAYFAGGCFWGVEYYFNKTKGVIDAKSGYMGGELENPTYEDVCSKKSGHLEVVRVKYDPSVTSYEDLAKLFFEIHDPTQENGQGPDIGPQYISAVFVNNEEEKEVIKKLINELKENGYNVVTKILEMSKFYEAESYHQYYYQRHGKLPYCHSFVRRFK
ncbi:bifunctional methionine sulfoxide reductase B/A protein [Sulfurospirillum sp. 1307]|jgi:peptide methionine sulfoxide reductase msrA/msrB